jgi:hypothetical protein
MQHLIFFFYLAFSLRDLGVAGLPPRRRDTGVETGVEGPATGVAEERLGVSFSSKTSCPSGWQGFILLLFEWLRCALWLIATISSEIHEEKGVL